MALLCGAASLVVCLRVRYSRKDLAPQGAVPILLPPTPLSRAHGGRRRGCGAARAADSLKTSEMRGPAAGASGPVPRRARSSLSSACWKRSCAGGAPSAVRKVDQPGAGGAAVGERGGEEGRRAGEGSVVGGGAPDGRGDGGAAGQWGYDSGAQE